MNGGRFVLLHKNDVQPIVQLKALEGREIGLQFPQRRRYGRASYHVGGQGGNDAFGNRLCGGTDAGSGGHIQRLHQRAGIGRQRLLALRQRDLYIHGAGAEVGLRHAADVIQGHSLIERQFLANALGIAKGERGILQPLGRVAHGTAKAGNGADQLLLLDARQLSGSHIAIARAGKFIIQQLAHIFHFIALVGVGGGIEHAGALVVIEPHKGAGRQPLAHNVLLEATAVAAAQHICEQLERIEIGRAAHRPGHTNGIARNLYLGIHQRFGCADLAAGDLIHGGGGKCRGIGIAVQRLHHGWPGRNIAIIRLDQRLGLRHINIAHNDQRGVVGPIVLGVKILHFF